MRTKEDFFTAIQNVSKRNIPLVDYHMHTAWTDGAQSVRQMYERAIALGMTEILFSEHARKSSETWFGQYAKEVRSLPMSPCRALVGIETKVADLQGKLDCTPALIAQCDLVMAVVHRFPRKGDGDVLDFDEVPIEDALQLEYKMSNAALENPDVDILGHPFGMCLRRYHVCPPDNLIRALIQKAAVHHVAFEVNSHYHPDPWKLIEWCREFKTLFSLGSDAHSIDEVGRITRVLQGKETTWTPCVS